MLYTGTQFATINSSDSYTFYTTSNSAQIRFRSGGSGFEGSITNISVIEITDDTNLPRINYEGFSYQDSLGSELVTNGDFATDSSWSKINATISGGTGNLNGTGVTSMLYQNILTNGKTYKAIFTVSDYNGLGESRVIDSSGSAIYTITSNGTFTFTFTYSNVDGNFLFRARNGSIFSIDNVSVKEVLGQEVVPDSGCGSWLFEPQSTNLLTYSEDFSNAGWNKGGVNISSIGISPRGSISTLLTEDTSNGEHRIYHNNIRVSNGLVYTDSFYIKSNGRSKIRLSYNGFNNYEPKFDFVNNNLISSTGGTAANIESVSFGNGWYRVCVTDTATEIDLRGVISLMKDDGSFIYVGDGTSGAYIWGAQLEQLSYATSYIPTNGSTVTRLQDAAFGAGSSDLINSTEGVLYAEVAALANDGTFRQLTLSNNSTSNRVSIDFTNTDNQIRSFSSSAGSAVANMSGSVSDATQFNKIAVKYKLNDYALWINGLQVATDTSGSAPVGLSELSFDNGGGSNDFFGKTKCLAVFKEALTDEELECLTTDETSYSSFTALALANNYTII